MSSKPYFATLPINEIGVELEKRVKDYYDWLKTSGTYAQLSRQVYQWQKAAVHGSTIPKGGNSSEYDLLYTNHFRTIGERIVNDVTSQKPVFKCRSGNTDASTQQQSKLGNVILDHYWRESGLQDNVREAAEVSVFVNEGYIYNPWRTNAGTILGYKPISKAFMNAPSESDKVQQLDSEGSPVSDYEQGNDTDGLDGEDELYDLDPTQEIDHNNFMPVYDGDIQFYVLGLMDVARDYSSPKYEYCNWFDVRTYVNKYELAKQYPEFKEKIESYVPTENDRNFRYMKGRYETDYIPLREFYHKNNMLVPGGLYVKWISENLVLEMSALPYADIPLSRMRESEMKDLPFAYSRASDACPLQIAYDRLSATLFSNQSTFGSQTFTVQEGADPQYDKLGDGMNVITFKVGYEPPQILHKLQTPPEIGNNIINLYQQQLLIWGINETMMGTPGGDIATAKGQMLQYNIYMKNSTPIQNAYSKLLTDVANSVLSIIQMYAEAPRFAKIVGKSDDYMLKEWNRDSIKDVSTVIVELGNPNIGTPGYIVEVAEMLLKYGVQIDPAKLEQSLQNLNMNFMTDANNNTEILISTENEKLAEGEQQLVSPYDRHDQHIQEHNEKVNDPEIRNNPQALQMYIAHIMEHYQAWKNADPGLLTALAIPPFPAPPPEPPVNIKDVPHVVKKTTIEDEEEKEELPPPNSIIRKTTIG